LWADLGAVLLRSFSQPFSIRQSIAQVGTELISSTALLVSVCHFKVLGERYQTQFQTVLVADLRLKPGNANC
jgi:hypothetical protein